MIVRSHCRKSNGRRVLVKRYIRKKERKHAVSEDLINFMKKNKFKTSFTEKVEQEPNSKFLSPESGVLVSFDVPITPMEEDKKTLEKISKVDELAKRGSTENEREVASNLSTKLKSKLKSIQKPTLPPFKPYG